MPSPPPRRSSGAWRRCSASPSTQSSCPRCGCWRRCAARG
jgi:hypothetical protein